MKNGAATTVLYDEIGKGYAEFRRPDARIEAEIHEALADSRSVLNVGAGAGSYEPSGRIVVAVEPSATMIDQRPANAATVVQATASSLPFADHSFDAAMAVLTVHHWPDRALGLREMRRVARDRIVILTWDPAFPGFWLCDYFPEIMDIDRPIFPTINDFERELGPVETTVVPIPHDCCDGFMCAYWRRPEAYLDSNVRSAISTFSKITDIEPALERLAADLETGAWHEKNANVLEKERLDLGYRLVVRRGLDD